MSPDASRVWIALIPVIGSALTAVIALVRSLKEKNIESNQTDKAQLWERVTALERNRDDNEKRAAVRQRQIDFIKDKLNTLRFKYFRLDGEFHSLLNDYKRLCEQTNTPMATHWTKERPKLELDWDEADFPEMPENLKPHLTVDEGLEIELIEDGNDPPKTDGS